MLKFLERRWSSGKEIVQHEQELELAVTRLVFSMMKMDNRLDKRECDGIVQLVSKRFEMNIDAAEALLLEVDQTDGDAPRFKQLAQQINKNFNRREVTALLGEVLSVAEADDHEDCYEKRYISRIASLLGISAEALSKAKLRCKAI